MAANGGPIDTTRLSELLGKIYDAALDDALWTPTVGEMMRQVGANCAWMYGATVTGSPPTEVLANHMPEDVWPLYLAYYWQNDVWIERALAKGTMRPGFICHSDGLLDRREFRQTEFYQDYCRPREVEVHLGGMLFDGNDTDQGPFCYLNFFRPPGAEAFDASNEKLLRYLFPHLQRSLLIRWRLVREKQAQTLHDHALNRLEQAVVLTDETGVALFANSKAEAIFREGCGPVVQNRRLAASWSQGTSSIKECLLRAALGVGSGLRLASPANGRQWVITFSPLRGSSQAPSQNARVLALIAEPDRPPSGGLPQFAALYGLTPAETRLLDRLLWQESTQDIAETLQISIKTLRSQLSSMFAKTGTTSQKELVRFYLSHPAVAEAPSE